MTDETFEDTHPPGNVPVNRNGGPATFLSLEELLPRLPVCERSAREWTRRGLLPSIKLPGSRRVLYHWPSVERALLRLQRGGGDL